MDGIGEPYDAIVLDVMLPVRRGDQTIGLTPKEFSLLEYYMRHPG